MCALNKQYVLNNHMHLTTSIYSNDRKHIVMQALTNSGSNFYNYKGTFSIVLLAVCNAQYCFTLLDISDTERQSDV